MEEQTKMNWDILHYWVTHLGDGSWVQFRKAVEELASRDADTSSLCRTLRVCLSERGHVDFFTRGSQNWRVNPPVLTGSQSRVGIAVLCGGKTPKLVSTLERVAENLDCRIIIKTTPQGISEVYLEGTEEAIASTANAVNVPYIANRVERLCQSLVPILKQLEAAPEASFPENWEVCSFDLQSKKWVKDKLPCTVYECTSRYQVRRYFVSIGKAKLVEMHKREAVYAAAALRGARIATYDLVHRKLSTPISAPLPEMYARIACLSSGQQSRVEQGCFVYENIAPDLAAFLLVAAGQPHPGIRWVKDMN